jgi:hypothetical protein
MILLFYALRFDEYLALVIEMAIVLIGFVPDMGFGSLRTNGNFRRRRFIVGAALMLTLFRMTALRMCHDVCGIN